MRGIRKCESCQWFEDRSEEYRERFVRGDGLCHWRCPATVAENFDGWGDWHQKGPALVKKEDWCSCWDKVAEHHIDVGSCDFPKPSFDARDLAASFCKMANELGYQDKYGKPIDEGWMTKWFANALMRGYDQPHPKSE